MSAKYIRLSSSPEEPPVPLSEGIVDDEDENKCCTHAENSETLFAPPFAPFEFDREQQRYQDGMFDGYNGPKESFVEKMKLFIQSCYLPNKNVLIIAILTIGFVICNWTMQKYLFSPYLMALDTTDSSMDGFVLVYSNFESDGNMELEYRPKEQADKSWDVMRTDDGGTEYVEISLSWYGFETKFKEWLKDRWHDSDTHYPIIFWIRGSFIPHFAWVCVDDSTTYVMFRQGSSTWQFRCDNHPSGECASLVKHHSKTLSLTKFRDVVSQSLYCNDTPEHPFFCTK